MSGLRQLKGKFYAISALIFKWLNINNLEIYCGDSRAIFVNIVYSIKAIFGAGESELKLSYSFFFTG